MTVHGVELYYETYGRGTPILTLHGTPSSAVLYVEAAGVLAERGLCVIYDRRGFNRSPAPTAFDTVDMSDQVADAVGLLEHLGVDRAVLVGRSTGGQIAIAIAHQHPDRVRALVLLEPAMFSVEPRADAFARELRTRVLAAADRDPASVAEVVVREALGDETWRGLPPDLRQMFVDAGPALLAEVRGRGLDLSEEPFALADEELAKLRPPTLLVTGADSLDACRVVNEHLARTLPRAETAVVPGGHLINPADPVVLDFLDRLLAPSA